MKLLQSTQYLTAEEAEGIIRFLDDIREMLLANYGEEIRQHHRTRLKSDRKNNNKDSSQLE